MQFKLWTIITVSITYPKFIFTSIHDDGCDWLIHEDEDGSQQGRRQCSRNGPPRIGKWRNEPAAAFPRRFELAWHLKFMCFDTG